MRDREALAERLEQCLDPYWGGPSPAPALSADEWRLVIAALRAQDREGARPDIMEALKREARDQKFHRDLADGTHARLKEKLCQAAHLAFAGNDCALRRLVDTIENPKPIYGSGAPAADLALAEQEKGL